VNTYTVAPATDTAPGGGVNGTGRRTKCMAWGVKSPQGKFVRFFDVIREGRVIDTEESAKRKAEEWAAFCSENC